MNVKHLQTLMGQPSTDGLSDIMRTQHRVAEELLFRTIELTALVEAGQHRFIGRALDDLERAECRLGQTELVRSAMTEAILGSRKGVEPSLSEVLASVDDETATAISATATEIRAVLAKIAEVRQGAASAAAERATRAGRALSAATSEAGLYGRA